MNTFFTTKWNITELT